MAKKKLYVATLRVAVSAEYCGNSQDGACDWFHGLLSENPKCSTGLTDPVKDPTPYRNS